MTTVASIDGLPSLGGQHLDVTLEVKDATKPACAAQVVLRFYR
jgi:hypothetical protein